TNFEDAAGILRELFAQQFPRLAQADWLAAARNSFKIADGNLVPTYDVRLASTLDGIDVSKPQPPLWGAFDALTAEPLLVLRGANSDLLSQQTVEAMSARHPAM